MKKLFIILIIMQMFAACSEKVPCDELRIEYEELKQQNNILKQENAMLRADCDTLKSALKEVRDILSE